MRRTTEGCVNRAELEDGSEAFVVYSDVDEEYKCQLPVDYWRV